MNAVRILQSLLEGSDEIELTTKVRKKINDILKADLSQKAEAWELLGKVLAQLSEESIDTVGELVKENSNLIVKNFSQSIHILSKSTESSELEELLNVVHIFSDTNDGKSCLRTLLFDVLSVLMIPDVSFHCKLEAAKVSNLLLEGTGGTYIESAKEKDIVSRTLSQGERREYLLLKEIAPTFAKLLSRKQFPILLKEAGDYELQATLLEYIFRITNHKERLEFVSNWGWSTKMSEPFLNIQTEEFEADCRIFINVFNESYYGKRSVYSYPCVSMSMGMYKLKKPIDKRLEDFWIDFNLSSASISAFVHDDSKAETYDTEWEIVVIKQDAVKDFRMNSNGNENILILKLTEPAYTLVPFCPEAPERYIKLSFCKKTTVEQGIKKLFGTVKYVDVPCASPYVVSTPTKVSMAKVPLSIRFQDSRGEVTSSQEICDDTTRNERHVIPESQENHTLSTLPENPEKKTVSTTTQVTSHETTTKQDNRGTVSAIKSSENNLATPTSTSVEEDNQGRLSLVSHDQNQPSSVKSSSTHSSIGELPCDSGKKGSSSNVKDKVSKTNKKELKCKELRSIQPKKKSVSSNAYSPFSFPKDQSDTEDETFTEPHFNAPSSVPKMKKKLAKKQKTYSSKQTSGQRARSRKTKISHKEKQLDKKRYDISPPEETSNFVELRRSKRANRKENNVPIDDKQATERAESKRSKMRPKMSSESSTGDSSSKSKFSKKKTPPRKRNLSTIPTPESDCIGKHQESLISLQPDHDVNESEETDKIHKKKEVSTLQAKHRGVSDSDDDESIHENNSSSNTEGKTSPSFSDSSNSSVFEASAESNDTKNSSRSRSETNIPTPTPVTFKHGTDPETPCRDNCQEDYSLRKKPSSIQSLTSLFDGVKKDAEKRHITAQKKFRSPLALVSDGRKHDNTPLAIKGPSRLCQEERTSHPDHDDWNLNSSKRGANYAYGYHIETMDNQRCTQRETKTVKSCSSVVNESGYGDKDIVNKFAEICKVIVDPSFTMENSKEEEQVRTTKERDEHLTTPARGSCDDSGICTDTSLNTSCKLSKTGQPALPHMQSDDPDDHNEQSRKDFRRKREQDNAKKMTSQSMGFCIEETRVAVDQFVLRDNSNSEPKSKKQTQVKHVRKKGKRKQVENMEEEQLSVYTRASKRTKSCVSGGFDTSPSNEDKDIRDEMSILMQSFGASMGKSMKDKYKTLDTFSRSIQNVFFGHYEELHSDHKHERENFIGAYLDQMTKEEEWCRKEISKQKQLEENLQTFLSKHCKDVNESRSQFEKRINKLGRVRQVFIEELRKLEEEHHAAQVDSQEKLREEIFKMQRRYLKKSQQQELVGIKKSLQSIISSV